MADGGALSLRIAIEQCGSLVALEARLSRLREHPENVSLRRLSAKWIREARLPGLSAELSESLVERRLLEDESMLAGKAEIWSEEGRRKGREEGFLDGERSLLCRQA